MEPDQDENEKKDQDYKPHGIPARQGIMPPQEKYSRRSKRYGPGELSTAELLVCNHLCIQLIPLVICINISKIARWNLG
jgi:hypothetical protein